VHPKVSSVAILPTPQSDKSYDRERTNRKRAAVLAHVGRFEFDPRGFEVIEGKEARENNPFDSIRPSSAA
jgi:hypothetical protein